VQAESRNFLKLGPRLRGDDGKMSFLPGEIGL